jgi:hypothetical protein
VSAGPAAGRPAHDPGGITTPALMLLAAVAFVTELALFGGVGAIAYAAADGGGVAAWLAAAAATVAVVVLWGMFMAPRARWRLGPGVRTLLAFLLCGATAVGLVAAGWTWWGWFVGIAGLAVVAAQTAPHERAAARRPR